MSSKNWLFIIHYKVSKNQIVFGFGDLQDVDVGSGWMDLSLHFSFGVLMSFKYLRENGSFQCNVMMLYDASGWMFGCNYHRLFLYPIGIIGFCTLQPNKIMEAKL